MAKQTAAHISLVAAVLTNVDYHSRYNPVEICGLSELAARNRFPACQALAFQCGSALRACDRILSHALSQKVSYPNPKSEGSI
jgi:hypothetical protein